MAVGSKLVGIATGLVVRTLSVKVMNATWRRTRHTDPPADPNSPNVPWSDALIWAASSGVAVGVMRLVATRGTASAVKKVTGRPPEGMEGPGPKR